MRVRWTKKSLEHLRGIYAHIAQDSPRYAQQMVDRITARSQQIGRFPLLGAVVPDYHPQEVREVIERVNTVHKPVNQKFVVREQDHRLELRVVPVCRPPKAAVPA